MPIQSLSDAIKLYETIGKYIPDLPSEDYLDYVDTILENIKQSKNYDAYLDAIQIMTRIDKKELLGKATDDVLIIFINALAEWHIVELVTFFRNVRYKL